MSRATSFVSVAQQVSLSLGVALWHGAGGDAQRTGLDCAATGRLHPRLPHRRRVSALAVFSFMNLPKDAGAELSGHKEKPSTLPDPRGEVNTAGS